MMFAGVIFGVLSLASSVTELDLAGEWSLSGKGRWAESIDCPMAVPGGVHSALVRAGLSRDVFWGANEQKTYWIARHDWTVSRFFEIPAGLLVKREIVLRLEDCDTFCTISVNGHEVGQTSNRFQRYTFDVKPYLKAGRNEIRGFFESPVRKADELFHRYGRPYTMGNPPLAHNQALVRKPACHGGWDWGPELEVMGFCGAVKLLASDRPRIDYVYTAQHFNDDLSHCTLDVFADLSDGTTVTNRLEIDDPPLWWPNGAGPQRFYEYGIEVGGERLRRRIGLRKVEVLNERTKGSDGKDELSLVFRVNNRRLFMKGSNWIPCSAYENEQTPARYRDLLESAAKANMNMIRLWGGGQYEKDCFYDLCDELGLLVWHDMMHACALYPADESFLGQLRLELNHQLRRLRDHASIALWCGDNECIMAPTWWWEVRDDVARYQAEWAKRSAMQAEMVTKWDPTRRYWPSSPCCGPGDLSDAMREDRKGDMHNWDIWAGKCPLTGCYAYRPRFCSEYGFQSFPSLEVAETFFTREEIERHDWQFEWHQKAKGGNERIRKTMAENFRSPRDVESELLLSQFQQGMSVKLATEGWLAQRPHCMGTLYWQLNDNWPVASWSSIEYGGKWKPLHYLMRRAFAPLSILACPTVVGWQANFRQGKVFAVNDTAETVTGEMTLAYWTYEGKVVSSVVSPVVLPPDSATEIGAFKQPQDASPTFLVMTLKTAKNKVRNDWHFGFFKDLPLADAKIGTKVDGFTLSLTTDRPAFYVWANVRGLSGEFEDNCLTLLPGETVRIAFVAKSFKVVESEFRDSLSVRHLQGLTKQKEAK